MAEADEHVALVQLRATLSALSAAAQLETTTQREIFAAVSDAMGGATFNAATRAVMKAELEGFLIRLTQSQSGAPSGGGEAAVPAKRPRKAAQPQRRKKAAFSGEDEESEPSAEASEGDEEASDSDFEETSEDDEGEPWRKKGKKAAAPAPKKKATPAKAKAAPKAAAAKGGARASDAAAGAAAAAAAAAVAASRPAPSPGAAPSPAAAGAAGAGGAAAPSQLASRIAAMLAAAPAGLSAPELASALKVGKSEVNSAVYKMAAAKACRKEDTGGAPKWHATDATAALAAAAPAAGDDAAAEGAAAAAAAPKAAAAPAGGGGEGIDGVVVADLGANRRVMVSKFRGTSYVSVREFYEKDGEMRPGRKGISLPEEQWRAVLAARDLVDAAVDAIKPPDAA